MAKTLIAFFSRRGENWVDGSVRFLPKGNNEVIVEKIKAQLPEADVFQIDTVKKYSNDYMVCIEEAKQELRAKARPAIKGDIDISKYDTIYIGWPCWWGTLPMCMFTFIEKHDWTGKTVVPFTTHEGSGFGSGLRDLRAAVKGATVAKGLSLRGTAARSSDAQIEKFVAGGK